MSKLATGQALKREHPELQNMKFINFFPIFVGHFSCPGSGSGIRIRNTNWQAFWRKFRYLPFFFLYRYVNLPTLVP
jgi:hypothetical protein